MTAPKASIASRRRLLFIISRQRMDLYEALRNALSNEADCEIIIDRRGGERRAWRGAAAAAESKEQRAWHRRERISIDNEVRECGWAVVKITTWPDAHAPVRGPRLD